MSFVRANAAACALSAFPFPRWSPLPGRSTVCRSVGRSVRRLASFSVSRYVGLSVGRSVSRLASFSVGRYVGLSVGQSVSQMASFSIGLSVGRKVARSLDRLSVGGSVDPSIFLYLIISRNEATVAKSPSIITFLTPYYVGLSVGKWVARSRPSVGRWVGRSVRFFHT